LPGTSLASNTGGGLGLLEGGRDDLVWEVEVATEELNALVGEVPVVVAPVELLGNIAAGLEGP